MEDEYSTIVFIPSEVAYAIDFLSRNQTNQSYAFSLEEIREGTELPTLTKETLLSSPEIEMRIIKGEEYYRYESHASIIDRVEQALHNLLAEGKITYNNGYYALKR